MYKFNDLVKTCKDFQFDGSMTDNKQSIFNDFVNRNPPVTNVELDPDCYELFFDCDGEWFRGKGCDIKIESQHFDSQMEVLEGFTQNDNGEWDLSSGVILLDNGNECFERVIVSSPTQNNNYFFIYYPEQTTCQDFELVQSSVMFQTLDELGEKEWGCFYTCDETNWFLAVPGYYPSL